MRSALWFLALFAAAVAIALFATQSQGMLSLFWSSWRIDLSLNFALLLLIAAFALMYFAIRALSHLSQLPERAKAWRAIQRERAMHTQLHEAISLLLAGRYAKAKAQALQAEQNAALLAKNPDADARACAQVQLLAMLLAAQSSSQMQEGAQRDQFFEKSARLLSNTNESAWRETLGLTQARILMDMREPERALKVLDELPQGAKRRTLALRLKLRALRSTAKHSQALETARLLAKHGAFSDLAASSILRSLSKNLIDECQDSDQLIRCYATLQKSKPLDIHVSTHAAKRLLQWMPANENTQALASLARSWLEPNWEHVIALDAEIKLKYLQVLEQSFFSPHIEKDWLARIEKIQLAYPQDANLQYLAGQVFFKAQLWGKAQSQLELCLKNLTHEPLRRKAWKSLSALAEQRGDSQAALAAYRAAAD